MHGVILKKSSLQSYLVLIGHGEIVNLYHHKIQLGATSNVCLLRNRHVFLPTKEKSSHRSLTEIHIFADILSRNHAFKDQDLNDREYVDRD